MKRFEIDIQETKGFANPFRVQQVLYGRKSKMAGIRNKLHKVMFSQKADDVAKKSELSNALKKQQSKYNRLKKRRNVPDWEYI